jgi:hypothetical protein
MRQNTLNALSGAGFPESDPRGYGSPPGAHALNGLRTKPDYFAPSTTAQSSATPQAQQNVVFRGAPPVQRRSPQQSGHVSAAVPRPSSPPCYKSPGSSSPPRAPDTTEGRQLRQGGPQPPAALPFASRAPHPRISPLAGGGIMANGNQPQTTHTHPRVPRSGPDTAAQQIAMQHGQVPSNHNIHPRHAEQPYHAHEGQVERHPGQGLSTGPSSEWQAMYEQVMGLRTLSGSPSQEVTSQSHVSAHGGPQPQITSPRGFVRNRSGMPAAAQRGSPREGFGGT